MTYCEYIWPQVSLILMVLSCLRLAELFLKSEEKTSLAKYFSDLRRMNTAAGALRPIAISATRVFGSKLLSLRNFFISILFSLFWLKFWSLFFYFQSPTEWNEKINNLFSLPSVFVGIVVSSFVANFFVDYVSVLQTSWLLRRLRDEMGIFRCLGILALDLVLTTAVFVLLFTLIWEICKSIFLVGFAFTLDETGLSMLEEIWFYIKHLPSEVLGSISSTIHNVYELVWIHKLSGYMFQNMETNTPYVAEVPFTTWFFTTYMTSFLLWWFLAAVALFLFVAAIVGLAQIPRIQVALRVAPMVTLGIYLGALIVMVQTIRFYLGVAV